MGTQIQMFPKPARNNRIQVGLDAETLAIFRRYSELSHIPLSRICAETLKNVAPVYLELSQQLDKLSELQSLAQMRNHLDGVLSRFRMAMDYKVKDEI